MCSCPWQGSCNEVNFEVATQTILGFCEPTALLLVEAGSNTGQLHFQVSFTPSSYAAKFGSQLSPTWTIPPPSRIGTRSKSRLLIAWAGGLIKMTPTRWLVVQIGLKRGSVLHWVEQGGGNLWISDFTPFNWVPLANRHLKFSTKYSLSARAVHWEATRAELLPKERWPREWTHLQGSAPHSQRQAIAEGPTHSSKAKARWWRRADAPQACV